MVDTFVDNSTGFCLNCGKKLLLNEYECKRCGWAYSVLHDPKANKYTIEAKYPVLPWKEGVSHYKGLVLISNPTEIIIKANGHHLVSFVAPFFIEAERMAKEWIEDLFIQLEKHYTIAEIKNES